MDKVELAKKYIRTFDEGWGVIESRLDDVGDAIAGTINNFQKDNMDKLQIKTFSVAEGNMALQYGFLSELKRMMESLERKSGDPESVMEFYQLYMNECNELFNRCFADALERHMRYVENMDHVNEQIAVYGKYEINLLEEYVATPLNTVSLHLFSRACEFWEYGIPSQEEIQYIINNVFVPFLEKHSRIRSYSL